MVMHRFAKPQAVEIRPQGSTPWLSAKHDALVDKMVKSSLSKGEILSVRI